MPRKDRDETNIEQGTPNIEHRSEMQEMQIQDKAKMQGMGIALWELGGTIGIRRELMVGMCCAPDWEILVLILDGNRCN
jgi:hypothetical protein